MIIQHQHKLQSVKWMDIKSAWNGWRFNWKECVTMSTIASVWITQAQIRHKQQLVWTEAPHIVLLIITEIHQQHPRKLIENARKKNKKKEREKNYHSVLITFSDDLFSVCIPPILYDVRLCSSFSRLMMIPANLSRSFLSCIFIVDFVKLFSVKTLFQQTYSIDPFGSVTFCLSSRSLSLSLL